MQGCLKCYTIMACVIMYLRRNYRKKYHKHFFKEKRHLKFVNTRKYVELKYLPGQSSLTQLPPSQSTSCEQALLDPEQALLRLLVPEPQRVEQGPQLDQGPTSAGK